MQFITGILAALGCYLIATSLLQGVYAPAEAALRRRAPKPLSQSELMIQAIASRLQPLMDIEPVKRIRMEEILRSLGRAESPEMFQALGLTKALMISAALSPLLLVSPQVGIVLMVIVCAALYSNQMQRLERDIAEKWQRIERELPQFASTIRQSLNNTHDVVAILSTYRKVCGPVLRDEIDHTLNDMITGNAEGALKSLESRVSSAKLGQLVRGLIAVLRGDDLGSAQSLDFAPRRPLLIHLSNFYGTPTGHGMRFSADSCFLSGEVVKYILYSGNTLEKKRGTKNEKQETTVPGAHWSPDLLPGRPRAGR